MTKEELLASGELDFTVSKRKMNYINELIKSVNTPATEAVPKTKGKTGDIRVLDAGTEHKLQIRTKDGWANLVDSNSNDITTKLS